jgi:hypothetical protein
MHGNNTAPPGWPRCGLSHRRALRESSPDDLLLHNAGPAGNIGPACEEATRGFGAPGLLRGPTAPWKRLMAMSRCWRVSFQLDRRVLGPGVGSMAAVPQTRDHRQVKLRSNDCCKFTTHYIRRSISQPKEIKRSNLSKERHPNHFTTSSPLLQLPLRPLPQLLRQPLITPLLRRHSLHPNRLIVRPILQISFRRRRSPRLRIRPLLLT